MPTWLVHGFRWPRIQIRIHTIFQNLDDVASEWIMAPATSACLLESFKKEFPKEMEQLLDLRFLEQHDPEDLTVKDQPYAYVCDQVHEIKLGADIDEMRGDGGKNDQLAAMEDLRDKIAPDAKLGWFVVVNGDVERWAPSLDSDEEEEYIDDEEDEEIETNTITPTSETSYTAKSSSAPSQEQERPSTSKSFKNWFGGQVKKARSLKDLRAEMARKELPPPLPPIPPSAAIKSSTPTKPPTPTKVDKPVLKERKSTSFRKRWLSSEKNTAKT